MSNSLLALAQGARQHKLSKPRMTEQNVIQIKNGRQVTLHELEALQLTDA